jgi:hypothetical protein
MRDFDAAHLWPPIWVAEDQVGRDNAVLEDMLAVIKIGEQQIDRGDALLDATLDPVPFRRGQDPRDCIKRQNAVDRLAIGIDGEGDPEIVKRLLGKTCAAFELGDRHAGEALSDVRRRRTAEHLAIEIAGIVGIENEVAHLAPLSPVSSVDMHRARQSVG